MTHPQSLYHRTRRRCRHSPAFERSKASGTISPTATRRKHHNPPRNHHKAQPLKNTMSRPSGKKMNEARKTERSKTARKRVFWGFMPQQTIYPKPTPQFEKPLGDRRSVSCREIIFWLQVFWLTPNFSVDSKFFNRLQIHPP